MRARRGDIFCAAAAFAAVLALRVSYEVSAGLETGNALIDTLSRIPNSFRHDSLPDLLLFAALFGMLRFVRGREKRADGWHAVLAVLLAGMTLVGTACHTMGDLSFFFADAYQLCQSLVCLAGYTALFYALLRLASMALERPLSAEGRRLRRPVRTGALVIFLCWLPWLLMNYPGSFCPDSGSQLGQWAGLFPLTAHHPPLSTALMGLCWSLGRLLGSANLGCFFYILLQSVCGALIFSYSLSVLYRRGLPHGVWLAMLLFFALVPIWGCFAQWFEKDLLYAEIFTLTLSRLFPVLWERRCSAGTALGIAAAALLAVLLRKTGLYELCPALLLAALLLRGADRRRLLCGFLAVVLLGVGAERALYPALGIERGSVREALSIPFQQTARYVCTYPDEVTPEERAAIDAVLDYDSLNSYDPIISDPVKNTYREDPSALGPYIRVWLRMLFRHPLCGLEAALMGSYGYFSTACVSLDAYILVDNGSVLGPLAGELGVSRPLGALPAAFFNSLRECFTQLPLLQTLCTAGFYTWLALFCLVQLIRRRQGAAAVLLLPAAMNVLVCAASPLSVSLRYELPTAAAAPLLLGMTLLFIHRGPEAPERG